MAAMLPVQSALFGGYCGNGADDLYDNADRADFRTAVCIDSHLRFFRVSAF